MNPDEIIPLLDNPAIQAQLLPLLPEGGRTPEQLRALLRSPQLQQAVETFDAALQSGQLGELLRQFGVGSGGPSSQFFFSSSVNLFSFPGLEGFLRALQNQQQSQQPQQPSQQTQQSQQQQQQPQQQPQQPQQEKKDDDKMDTS